MSVVWPDGPLGKVKLGSITALPDAADELAKAVDAIQAAEGALSRCQGIVATDVLRLTLEQELRVLRAQRQRLLVLRGGPKAEPVHFVGGAFLP